MISADRVRCWNWEDDPEVDYDNLVGFSTVTLIRDAIISKDGRFIVTSSPTGSIRFQLLDSEGKGSLQTAFNCNDRNVRVIQSQKDESVFYLAGDKFIQQYNQSHQTLKVKGGDVFVFILITLYCRLLKGLL